MDQTDAVPIIMFDIGQRKKQTSIFVKKLKNGMTSTVDKRVNA